MYLYILKYVYSYNIIEMILGKKKKKEDGPTGKLALALAKPA